MLGSQSDSPVAPSLTIPALKQYPSYQTDTAFFLSLPDETTSDWWDSFRSCSYFGSTALLQQGCRQVEVQNYIQYIEHLHPSIEISKYIASAFICSFHHEIQL